MVGLAPELAGATEEQSLASHAAGARIVVRAASPGTQLAAIRCGLGLGVHACHVAEREPGVVRVADEVLLRDTYWAVAHVDTARSPRVRTMLDHLSQRAQDERARIEGERTPSTRKPREKSHRRAGSRKRPPEPN